MDYTLGLGNRLSSWGTNGVASYNTAGCMTNFVSNTDGSERSIEWDNQYQVERVKLEGINQEVNYDYNVLGQRIARKEITGSDLSADRQANTEYYIHDGANIVADLDEAKELIRSYNYAPGYDNIISMTTYGDSETNTYFYIRSHNNSVVALVDENGDITESYKYTAYGNVRVFNANGNELENSALGNRYTFQGRELDWTTGLYNFRTRWYSSETGRWLSKDPIGISGGLNQYVFCGNNPVMFIDPRGLWTVTIGGDAIIQLIPAAGADGGYAFGYSKEAKWTHGPVGSLNGGIGTPSGSAGGFFQWTTAKSVNDLKGFGLQLGAGIKHGPSFGLDYVAGLDMSSLDNLLNHPTYHGLQFNFGAGYGPLAADGHALLTLSGAIVFEGNKEPSEHKDFSGYKEPSEYKDFSGYKEPLDIKHTVEDK